MLVEPQQGNLLVLVMGLCLNLSRGFGFGSILQIPLLILWSRQKQWPKQSKLRTVPTAFLLTVFLFGALKVIPFLAELQQDNSFPLLEYCYYYSVKILPVIVVAGAVLLLILRPQRVANLTDSTTWGPRLLSVAKVISALCLAANHLASWCHPKQNTWDDFSTLHNTLDDFSTAISMLVLSLGSLQNRPVDSPFNRFTDAILHIFFISVLVQPIPTVAFQALVPSLSDPAATGLSWVVVLVLLLIGNLQIPTAVAQIVLSSLRLRKLLRHNHIDYTPEEMKKDPNMVPALQVFYVMTLCQGSLYIMASFLALLSPFPRRRLRRKFELGGELGEKVIDHYYEDAFESAMDKAVFGAQGKIMSFADFAIKSLSSRSSSRDLQVAGLYVLHKILLLRKTDMSKDLILRVTSGSDIAVSSTLIGMLPWAADVKKDRCDIRLLAARVTSELACKLRISSFPGMLKTVSSLLTDAVVLEAPNHQQPPGPQQTPLASANGGSVQSTQGSNGGSSCSWDCWLWQWMKPEYWSLPEDPTLSNQDSVPVLGMKILEELAVDLDNCAEILRDDKTNLISKTIGIIGYASTSNNKQNDKLVCSSLKFLKRLAETGERIGVELRHELWSHPFLLTSLARALELEDDPSSSSSNSSSSSSSSSRRPHQIWEPAMDIIAKLALDSAAGPEIGRNQVITARLMHVFLWRPEQTNMNYDLSLRKASGEALANLALWGTEKDILKEPRYDDVINDLKNMLSDDEHRYVAASLLLSHPRASQHLSSALTIVMEQIIKVEEGKQLECLINLASEILLKKNLASEIGDVMSKAFVQSQNNIIGAKFVQKLFTTLDSKKVPSPEYPRMRRVIVKIIISILELCHHTVNKLMEEQLIEKSLTNIARTPSKVEEYRVFYGNIGVVLENDGESMSTLVARAKALLVRRPTQTGEAQAGNHL